MQNKENRGLGEDIYVSTLPQGVKCYIIPKKEFVQKQAMVLVNYGSRDTMYRLDEGLYETPMGIAHYLEHKLFEEENGNIFDEFTKTGAMANAFTNFDMTGYYFTCADDRFYQNLELLLGFVQRPYFTNENVEKERGIISQEITMYDDHPAWQVYLNMVNGMYQHDTIKHSIAGSAESISKITPELLHQCYNAFYTPDNMAVVCVGDVDVEETFHRVSEPFCGGAIRHSVPNSRCFADEPKSVSNGIVKKNMPVAQPIFNIGFKDDRPPTTAYEEITSRILMDLLAGESSRFYTDMFKQTALNESFGYDYILGSNYGHAILAGDTKEPKKVLDALVKEIKRIRRQGFEAGYFERIKKKYLGRFLRRFNAVDSITHCQAELAFKSYDVLDLYDAATNVNVVDVEKKLAQLLREDNVVMSVVSK